MNASEIKKSLEKNGYDQTLKLVIEDTKKSKIKSCLGSGIDYSSFAASRIDAVKNNK